MKCACSVHKGIITWPTWENKTAKEVYWPPESWLMIIFWEKKGQQTRLTNKKLNKSVESSSLFFWVSCVSLGVLCMLLKSVFGVMNWLFCHCMFSLHCIWIPVYPVRGVGRLPPGPTLTLLYTGFERKGTPFIYFLLTKWYPFYIPSLELLDVLELL